MALKISNGLFEDAEYEAPKPLSDIFEHEPVSLEVFIRDKAFLGADWMLSPKQIELVRVGERVYQQSLFDQMAVEFGGYWADPIPMKNSIVAQWGKGGGKDSTVRVISARVAYLLMCLKSPQAYFGMPLDDSIHLLNIAVNAAQASRAFFDPLAKMVTRGFMSQYADPKRDTINYAKNVQAISGHSDAESQEGLNILLGVADEIDAFKAKGEMVGQGNKAREASTSAESILNMIESSAMSRFPSNYKRIAISFPRYLGSTIQRLTHEAKADIEKYGDRSSVFFASGPYATWEVNPTKTKEDFAAKYREDPDEAAARYECKPSRATDAYFRNPVIFTQAVVAPEQPITVDYRMTTFVSPQTGARVQGWKAIFNFADDFKAIAGARYAIHADLAIKGDRAGVSMSHVASWVERTDEVLDEDGFVSSVQTMAPIVRNDFTISLSADVGALHPLTGASAPREIQITWVRDLAFELIKRGFSVGSFTFDGYQSTDAIQILLMHGIESKKMSTDTDPDIWKTLKDVASEARLLMPFSQLLQNELEALSRVDGKKVDHPPAGSKDEADAFACSVNGALILGGGEDPNGATFDVQTYTIDVGDATTALEGMDYMMGGGFEGGVALPIGMKEVFSGGYEHF
jgi:hypothetical protein